MQDVYKRQDVGIALSVGNILSLVHHVHGCLLYTSNTLFIQTCDSGYDYTLYGPDNKALDGGQLDAPGLTLPDTGEEALALLGQIAVSYTHLTPRMIVRLP